MRDARAGNLRWCAVSVELAEGPILLTESPSDLDDLTTRLAGELREYIAISLAISEDVTARMLTAALHERILAIVGDRPGLSCNGIVRQARMRRRVVLAALQQLAAAGRVSPVKAGRARRWFVASRAT